LNRIWRIDETRSVLIDPAVNPITQTGEEKSDFIFVCSRIEKSKDIDVLIAAYKSSELLQKTYKLIIAGAVIAETREYAGLLKKMIGGLTNLITLHENPFHGEIEAYYNRAKIFWHAKGYSVDEEVNPFELEHFGLTTAEAMSAGCVPVVINKGGQKEIIENGVNGFLWDTSEQLIEKTIYLSDYDDERKKMSIRAMEKARKYSLENFTGNLSEVLKTNSNA
jgi:glycosyltransferase involved in cell wall biosynthesis